MAKLTIATALFIGPSLLLAQPRPIPTWNGLAFGMTLDEAKAALTDRNLKVVDNGDSLDVSGDMGAADGSAKLSFSLPQHRLEKIVLTFDYGLKDYGYSTNPGAADAHCRVDISMVSRDEAIRRAAFAGKVARKYLERYGKPIFATGDRFPVAGDSARWWEYDLINGEPWTAGVTLKWQGGGQQVKFDGYLLCRGARITVEYSPEDHSF